MRPHWGIVEETDDNDKFVAFHIVPMVTVDGDLLVSAAHDITRECACGTHYERGRKHQTDIWIHYDPDYAAADLGDDLDDMEDDRWKPPA
jgi:hypothetical protein